MATSSTASTSFVFIPPSETVTRVDAIYTPKTGAIDVKWLDASQVKKIYSGNCDVYLNGELILGLRAGCFSGGDSPSVIERLESLPKEELRRGTAAGPFVPANYPDKVFKKIKDSRGFPETKEGISSAFALCNPQWTTHGGSYDEKLKVQFLELVSKSSDVLVLAAEIFKQCWPEALAKHVKVLDETVIPDGFPEGPFTSCTVNLHKPSENKFSRTANHKDLKHRVDNAAQNIMLIFGRNVGSNTILFPELDLGFEMPVGTAVMFNGRRFLHGNGEFLPQDATVPMTRISFTAFILDVIQKKDISIQDRFQSLLSKRTFDEAVSSTFKFENVCISSRHNTTNLPILVGGETPNLITFNCNDEVHSVRLQAVDLETLEEKEELEISEVFKFSRSKEGNQVTLKLVVKKGGFLADSMNRLLQIKVNGVPILSHPLFVLITLPSGRTLVQQMRQARTATKSKLSKVSWYEEILESQLKAVPTSDGKKMKPTSDGDITDGE